MKKNILLSLGLTILMFCADAQSVTTYAGIAYTGTGQYNSQTVTRDKRYFSAPYGILVDTAVNILYVSQEHSVIVIQGNETYNRSGNSGDPSFSAGYVDATGIATKYSRPAGMALTKDRHVIIADQNNSLVRHLHKFVNVSNGSPSTTIAGQQSFLGGYQNGANAQAKFNGLQDVAVIGDDIFVADRSNHCIRKISNGVTSTLAGNQSVSGSSDGVGSAASFNLPMGLFAESSTTLLVADFGNGSIRRVNINTGQVTTVVTGLENPRDMVAVNGKIYIADEFSVQVYDGSTLKVYAGSRTQDGNKDGVGEEARFSNVVSIDYNPKEKAFYVVDQGVNVVKKISSSLPPVASFTASTVNASVGQTVVLKSTSTRNPTGFQWTISPSNYTLVLGSSLTDSVVYVNFTQANVYSVTLKATNPEGSDTEVKGNYINVSTSATAVTVADFEASNLNPETDEVVTLVDLSSYAPSAWTWTITPATGFTFVNGTDANSQYPQIKFTMKGAYTVKLDATNANGSDSEEKTNYINADWPLSSPTISTLDFIAYPNPVKETLFIQTGFNKRNIKIQLFNLNGGLVKSTINQEHLSVEDLPAGLYLVRVTSGTQSVIKKVWKE